MWCSAFALTETIVAPLVALALVFTVVFELPAHAAPRVIDVASTGCSDLEPAELEKLTVLELSSVLDPSHPDTTYRVEFACDGSVVRLTIEQEPARVAVKRIVPAPNRQTPERERTLALAVAQLYRATWREPTHADAAPAPVTPRPAPITPRPAPGASLAERHPEKRRQFVRELGVIGSFRVRNPAGALDLGSVSAEYTEWLGARVGLTATASGEFGTATRDAGKVDVRLLHLGAAAAFRSPPFAAFSVAGAAGVLATQVHMSGRPTQTGAGGAVGAPGVRGASVNGVRPELFADVVPGITAGPLFVGVRGEVGLMPRAPRGAVPGGAAVRADGPWVGVGLVVSVGKLPLTRNSQPD